MRGCADQSNALQSYLCTKHERTHSRIVSRIEEFLRHTKRFSWGSCNEIFGLKTLESYRPSGETSLLAASAARKSIAAGRRAVVHAAEQALAGWDLNAATQKEISFMPARVLLQDFTGVPAVVDLSPRCAKDSNWVVIRKR